MSEDRGRYPADRVVPDVSTSSAQVSAQLNERRPFGTDNVNDDALRTGHKGLVREDEKAARRENDCSRLYRGLQARVGPIWVRKRTNARAVLHVCTSWSAGIDWSDPRRPVWGWWTAQVGD